MVLSLRILRAPVCSVFVYVQSIVSSGCRVNDATLVVVLVESIVEPWLRSDAAQLSPVSLKVGPGSPSVTL